MYTKIPGSCISHIEIRGFRSLEDISLELSPLTVLIGANGAGKSNFIKFFELLHWLMDRRSLAQWITREGGADDNLFMGSRETEKLFWHLGLHTQDTEGHYQYEAAASLTSTNQLQFESEHYRYHKTSQPTPDWLQLSPSPEFSELPTPINRMAGESLGDYTRKGSPKIIASILKQCSVYQFHDTSKHATIKKEQDTSNSIYLSSDGGNLAAILLKLAEQNPKHYKLIEKQIGRVLPTFGGFVLEELSGKVMLRWRHKQGDKVIGAHLTSDGSLRLFCLVTLLNLPSKHLPYIILLDEPELGLHPNAVTLIAAMIRTLTARCQVILATQSPLMVDNFSLDDIVVADVVAGATRLRKLNQKAYQHWLEGDFTASDLWLSNVLSCKS